MATGGVFKLTANEGKTDKMIMATELLDDQIAKITCAKQKAGLKGINAYPKISEIEETHIIFPKSSFKPFATHAFEYNKVKPFSGSPALGQGLQFSIPQFGEFFHDMVIRVRLSSCQGVAMNTPVQGAQNNLFPANNAQGGLYYNLVDSFGSVVVAGAAQPNPAVPYINLVRYCEFPGERIFKKVKFEVSSNPLDEYTDFVSLMLRKFTLTPAKTDAYKRLVGQEVPIEGSRGVTAGLTRDNDSNTPANIRLDLQGHGTSLYSIPAAGMATTVLTSVNGVQNTYDFVREQIKVLDGPQTPKAIQPPLELWNKLKFWFCEDVGSSIPSVAIPYGQRFITVEMNTADKLVYEFCNLYLETIREVVGTGTDVAPTAPYTRTKTYTPIFLKGTVVAPTIERTEMYVNNIFVSKNIHDIYMRRIGFSLVRVFREQTARISQSGISETQLTSLKWPTEYMFVGVRPVWNVTDPIAGVNGVVSGNQYVYRDWHRMTKQLPVQYGANMLAEIPASAFATVPQAAPAAAGYGFGVNAVTDTVPGATSSIAPVVPNSYTIAVPTVEDLKLTSHGIEVFTTFMDNFYNSYMPYHYGGENIISPEDTGALMVNFAFKPRQFQPSGHFNLSRARETFIAINNTPSTTLYTGPNTQSDLIVVAIAINFLVIAEGSASLRYST